MNGKDIKKIMFKKSRCNAFEMSAEKWRDSTEDRSAPNRDLRLWSAKLQIEGRDDLIRLTNPAAGVIATTRSPHHHKMR
jgi:hypothetical protein